MPASKRHNSRRLARRSRRRPVLPRMKGGANYNLELSVCLQNVDVPLSEAIATNEVVSANQAAIVEKLDIFIQKILPSVENFEHISNLVFTYIGERKFRLDFTVSDDIIESERKYAAFSLSMELSQMSKSDNFISEMKKDSHIVVNGARYLIIFMLLDGYTDHEDACSFARVINYDKLIGEPINNGPINLPSLRQAFILSDVHTYEYDVIPKVYDVINLEDIPLTEVDMDGAIIFKHGPKFFVNSKDAIRGFIDSRKQIVFECNGQANPTRDTVREDVPFFKIWGPDATFLVELGELITALDDPDYKVFELVKERKLPFTTSYETVTVNNDMKGYNRQNVNYVSDDHCQAGTEKHVYKIHPLRMLHTGPMAGGRRRTMRIRNKRKQTRTIRR
jgi:hypothetical protein